MWVGGCVRVCVYGWAVSVRAGGRAACVALFVYHECSGRRSDDARHSGCARCAAGAPGPGAAGHLDVVEATAVVVGKVGPQVVGFVHGREFAERRVQRPVGQRVFSEVLVGHKHEWHIEPVAQRLRRPGGGRCIRSQQHAGVLIWRAESDLHRVAALAGHRLAKPKGPHHARYGMVAGVSGPDRLISASNAVRSMEAHISDPEAVHKMVTGVSDA